MRVQSNRRLDRCVLATHGHRPRVWVASLLLAGFGWSCDGAQSSSQSATSGARSNGVAATTPWFREVAADRGLNFMHQAHDGTVRHWIPEITSGGVGFIDFDNDGALDIYCVQSGSLNPPGQGPAANKLFKGDGRGGFTDVTPGSGLDDPGYGHGLCTGDYDGDGDMDLYVANLGPNKLFRNDGGGRFTDVTQAAGVGGTAWSAGCAFTDYDLDGDYDLFVVNNLNWSVSIERVCRTTRGELDYCAPLNYDAPSTDILYRNDGNGRFTDVSKEVGITATTGAGWGVAIADFNGDGFPDYYVTNDGMPNAMWMSDGQGKFTDQARRLGCAVNGNGRSEAGMGVQVIDLKNDGNWGLFMTHVREESNTYYSSKNGLFSDKTSVTGLGNSSLKYTGFGMGFHDFDDDGWLDLFIANGRVTLSRPLPREDALYAEENLFYRGLGDARFETIPTGTAETLIGTSRAAAFGDIDNDGDVDICYLDNGESVRLLENVAPKVGGWVGFRLIDKHGSDALGCALQLELEGDCAVPKQNQMQQTSYSFAASNDHRARFGTGKAQRAKSLSVTWPDGSRGTYGPFELGAYHVLRQSGD